MRAPMVLCLGLLGACGGKGDTAPPPVIIPVFSDLREIVPGDGLPAAVDVEQANNKLDVALFDGKVFLVFRSAPSHFSGPETTLWVVSSEDEVTWSLEGEIFVGSDLREPQLVVWDNKLFLYFAVLGTTSTAFEPQGARWVQYVQPLAWTELQPYPDDPTLVPWKIKVERGTLYMSAYANGGTIFDPDEDPIEVQLLTSADAVNWSPAAPAQPAVQIGGGSEMDFVIQDDGSLIAVIRNEAGIETSFGSLVCRAADGPTQAEPWECVSDKRKFDSPTMFMHGGKVYLMARRNVTADGFFDLGYGDMSPEDMYWDYLGVYATQPKRCSLWEVDAETLEVSLLVDLPSRGDTCHTELYPLDDTRYVVYNYSSDPFGADLSWTDGQQGATNIYRQILTMPAF